MPKYLPTAVCLVLALGFLKPAIAQYPASGIQGQIPMQGLSEMQDLLKLANAEQRADLFSRMGVDPVIAKAAAAELQPGQNILLEPIHSKGPQVYGLAFLPGGMNCFLYLLQDISSDRNRQQWRVVDHEPLDCWRRDAAIELVPLRNADQDDILVHHVNVSHGTGEVIDETRAFAVNQSRLTEIFHVEDYRLEDVPDQGVTITKKSTFLELPDMSLEETRALYRDDKLDKIERRYWRWSDSSNTFIPSRFVAVVSPQSFAQDPIWEGAPTDSEPLVPRPCNEALR